MTDLAVPNRLPGCCEKCRGSGVYRWGPTINGKSARSGPCHSCRGTGQQAQADIRRNVRYNRFKIAEILR